jgi:heme-degrading monooxygenase HmoA
MTVIVLVRRVARKDRVESFLARYRSEKPAERDGFITEYLTRVEGADSPGMRELGLLHPSTDGIAFLNVAFWESEQKFREAFSPLPGNFDPELECEPRRRAVLKVEELAGPLPVKWDSGGD